MNKKANKLTIVVSSVIPITLILIHLLIAKFLNVGLIATIIIAIGYVLFALIPMFFVYMDLLNSGMAGYNLKESLIILNDNMYYFFSETGVLTILYRYTGLIVWIVFWLFIFFYFNNKV